jgi:hypothetical protein
MAEKKGEGGRLSEGDMNFLKFTRTRDDLFPDIDPLWFKEVDHLAAG